jgi:flagellar biogenesis protein FliO
MKFPDVTNKKGWGWIALLIGMAAAALIFRIESTEPLTVGVRAVAALFLVLGIAVVGLQWLKKWQQQSLDGGQGPAVPIRILGSRGLGDGRSLFVVDVAGERFLIGGGKEGIVNLARLERGAEEDGMGSVAGDDR